jgi:hypothetical protein
MTLITGMATLTFTHTQAEALRTLRRLYRHDPDLFSAQELATCGSYAGST